MQNMKGLTAGMLVNAEDKFQSLPPCWVSEEEESSAVSSALDLDLHQA